ncbi:MAG: hypothetical protein ABIJ23_02595 [Candidatus Magasanikbacteria bacterium]
MGEIKVYPKKGMSESDALELDRLREEAIIDTGMRSYLFRRREGTAEEREEMKKAESDWLDTLPNSEEIKRAFESMWTSMYPEFYIDEHGIVKVEPESEQRALLIIKEIVDEFKQEEAEKAEKIKMIENMRPSQEEIEREARDFVDSIEKEGTGGLINGPKGQFIYLEYISRNMRDDFDYDSFKSGIADKYDGEIGIQDRLISQHPGWQREDFESLVEYIKTNKPDFVSSASVSKSFAQRDQNRRIIKKSRPRFWG